MIRESSITLSSKLFSLLCITLVVLSCTANNDPEQSLTSYCIRECVLETSASEICDTECKCAAEKLSGEYSEEEFNNLVLSIKEDNTDSILKLRNSLQSCKESSK